jgi:hypothetical protein
MGSAIFDLMLGGVFVGVLICVIAMIALKLACPPSSTARELLFRRGAIYPYTGVASLKLGVLLPWQTVPSFDGCHQCAGVLLGFARLGAGIAAVSLISLIALGVWSVAA